MKYKVSFEVSIPDIEWSRKLTDNQIIRYFQSEINFRDIGKDNPLEFWSFENCTENLKIVRLY